MHWELRIDGGCRRAQRLGDDVTSIETSPRIRVPDTDEGVGAVRFERDEIMKIHDTFTTTKTSPVTWLSSSNSPASVALNVKVFDSPFVVTPPPKS